MVAIPKDGRPIPTTRADPVMRAGSLALMLPTSTGMRHVRNAAASVRLRMPEASIRGDERRHARDGRTYQRTRARIAVGNQGIIFPKIGKIVLVYLRS